MCMRESKEACILLERMTKVETKQWMLIALVSVLIGILSLITFKLLDSQIYLMTGEQGLHSISNESRQDVKILQKVK